MEQERIQQALARIEAAASRIERAARRPAAPARAATPAPMPTLFTAADQDLARKHEALKREAWAALAELDAVIEAIDA